MSTANEDILPDTGHEEAAPVGKPTLMHRIRRRMRRRRVDATLQDVAVIEASGRFDKQWYLQRNPDIAKSGMDPIQHYVRHGAAEGRDPTEAFNTKFYLQDNPDVAASGVNPFRHYLEHGSKEGRQALPGMSTCSAEASTGTTGAVRPSSTEISHTQQNGAQTIARSGVFDRAYYLAACSGLVPSEVDPVEHYLQFGAAEGRNPCALFDTRYYLKRNPDVVASGMNPLVHFCRYGFKELRDPSPNFAIVWYALVHLDGDLNVNALAHYLTQGMRDELEIRAVAALSDQDKQNLAARSRRLLEEAEPRQRAVYLMIGRALARLSLWTDAEAAFSRALAIAWDDASTHASLAAILARQDKWWQAVESWSAATNLNPSRASWFLHLGEAQEKMNRFALAAEAYQRALKLEPDQPQWYYLLGYMHEKTGQQNLANSAYAQAVARDPRRDVKAFGIGVFHQTRGYWPEACEAYARKLEVKPWSAELHFKIGMAHDRCYRWEEAEAAYRKAIASKPDVPYWQYRLGFVLERQERLAEAAEAYTTAATLNSKAMPYWWYRCGYVLAKASKHEEACLAYIRTRETHTLWGRSYTEVEPARSVDAVTPCLHDYIAGLPGKELIADAVPSNPLDPECHYQLGALRERWGAWEGAAEAYAGAVARSNSHRPFWYYRLGFVLFLAGRFEQACDAFRETRILRRPHGVSEASFTNATPAVKTSTAYAEYFETLALRDDIILYESFIGSSVTCNPLALFKRLIKDPAYSKHLHVWVLDDPSRMPQQYRELPNVACVSRGSDGYLRYLCAAKYLINNSGFPPYFIRKEGQKYLATWHGTPLKTLGKEQKYKFYDHKRTQRNFLQATHIISPNPFTTGILLDSYDIRPIFTGLLAETGYPRVDQTLKISNRRHDELHQQLGTSGKRPLVLYAPTWRGTLENVAFDTERLESDIQYLSQRDCDIVFRGHSLMEEVLVGASIGCKVVPPAINTNELLSIVDVLITDYSSTFFDFLATGRPIIYYVYDQEAYEEERGLYFSMDEMPGFKCRDIVSLGSALDEALRSRIPDPEHLARSQRRFNCHDDGLATERVIQFFFDDDQAYVVVQGPRNACSVLINGGSFQPNGITTSFLNLVNSISADKIHFTVGFSPNPIEVDPAKMDYFKRMSKAVAAVPRYGSMVMSWEERWLRARYESGKRMDSTEAQQIVVDAFDREFQRIFGGGRFDVAISFSGYDAFWTSVLSMNHRPFRKAIYLHNDMYAEYQVKYPELIRMFNLYSYADALVSVSEETNQHNRSHLASQFDLAPSKFVACENVQDPQRILSLADEPLEKHDEELFDGRRTFINVSRLSPEKGHAKLIRAFARMHARHSDTRLLILGVGPLREDLIRLANELGLSKSVHLLGFRSNPYAYMRRADYFVLSSDHEGQPMTLLEALILEVPIVATDIVGNRSVLAPWPELLVDNSEFGLIRGMEQCLAGVTEKVHFDCGAYQGKAMCHFTRRVLDAEPCQPTSAINGPRS